MLNKQLKNIVYLIKINRDFFPNKYIGSKSNCYIEDGKIINSCGNEYRGSSKNKEYKNILKYCSYSLQILGEFDSYKEALLYENKVHKKYDVVANIEFFNLAIATINNYSDPNYATYRNVKTNKVARLPRDHPKVLNREWVGVTFGHKLSEKTKQKISRPGKLNGFYGRKHTEERNKKAGKKIGDAHRGKPKSDEHKKKMAKAALKRWAKIKKDKEKYEQICRNISNGQKNKKN